MARTDTLVHFLTDVADAIREKKGTSDTIQASDFDTEIENLPSDGSDLDWSAIGYDGTPQTIQDGYDYAKNIYDNWDSSVESLASKFKSNINLVYMPLVDTSNVTNMYNMFNDCTSLIYVPELDMKNVTDISNMFDGCTSLIDLDLSNSNISKAKYMGDMFRNCIKLSNETLDSILQMCITATSYNNAKTLYKLGLRSSNYPITRIEALPHYQDFIDAGWTIGY